MEPGKFGDERGWEALQGSVQGMRPPGRKPQQVLRSMAEPGGAFFPVP